MFPLTLSSSCHKPDNINITMSLYTPPVIHKKHYVEDVELDMSKYSHVIEDTFDSRNMRVLKEHQISHNVAVMSFLYNNKRLYVSTEYTKLLSTHTVRQK
jgi:hypothetical protein